VAGYRLGSRPVPQGHGFAGGRLDLASQIAGANHPIGALILTVAEHLKIVRPAVLHVNPLGTRGRRPHLIDHLPPDLGLPAIGQLLRARLLLLGRPAPQRMPSHADQRFAVRRDQERGMQQEPIALAVGRVAQMLDLPAGEIEFGGVADEQKPGRAAVLT